MGFGVMFWPRGPNLTPFQFLNGFRPSYFELLNFHIFLFYAYFTFVNCLVVLGAPKHTLIAWGGISRSTGIWPRASGSVYSRSGTSDGPAQS